MLKGKTRPDKMTYIGDGTYLEGKLTSKENLCIYGHFKGTIECHGRVVIGESGNIEADILADDIAISGKVVGNVTARNSLEITSTGIVKGDIETSRIIMENGSKFDGQCKMQLDKGVAEKTEAADMSPSIAREA